jgi:hypothetical protein
MKGVLQNLKPYQKLKAPAKPVDIPPDVTMCKLMQKYRNEQRMTQDERDITRLFGNWRALVFEIEGQNTARLGTLLSVLRALEAQEGGITDRSKKLRKFIRDQFGRWPPEVVTSKTIRQDAEQLCFEMGLLNRNLRHGELVE